MSLLLSLLCAFGPFVIDKHYETRKNPAGYTEAVTVTTIHLVSPAHLQEAHGWIAADEPEEPPAYLGRALRLASIQRELLDPESAHGYFRGPQENALDLRTVRTRRSYWYPSDDYHRFDAYSTQWLAQERERLWQLRRTLWETATLWPDKELVIRSQCAELRDLMDLYSSVASCRIQSAPSRRETLTKLRGQLSDDEWNMGVLPLWIP